jgi:hypothetical protein
MSNALPARLATSLLLALFLTMSLSGQQTTGSLSGNISDSTGAVLPGVTVEISGPALQGTRAATTSSDGRYRFLNLPPGDGYRIGATLSGFESVSKRDMHVFLGQEGTSNVVLRPAMAQEISVTADTPLVDVTRTTTGLNITAKQFESLPTTRSFQSLSVMTPGVTLEFAQAQPGRTGQFANSPAVGGGTPPENNYIIEGLSTTQTLLGTSGTNLTMNFVEEVQVITGGYSAELGRSTGGVFNVVTKSGSNALHGDLFGYYQGQSWSARNIRRQFLGTSTLADGEKNSDLGITIGGPVLRDKLWFFVAYDPTRRTTFSHEFTDRTGAFIEENHQFDTNMDFRAAKLTWTSSPQSTFVATMFGDPRVREGWLGGARTDPPAALRRWETGGNNYVARYSTVVGSGTLLEARAGRHQNKNKGRPITEIGRTVPTQIDDTTGITHGGSVGHWEELGARNSAAIKATSLLSTHEILAGIDLERNNYDVGSQDHWFVFRGQRRINADLGRQDRLDEFTDSETGFGHTDNLAGYLEDHWRALSNLQFNVGLRYEVQTLDSANDVFVVSGYEPDGTIHPHKTDKLTLDHNWAPRLGIVWDPQKNGRSKIFGYAGRYFEAIPLLINVATMNGGTAVTNRYYSLTRHDSQNWFNPTGSPLSSDWIPDQTLNSVPDDAGGHAPLDENLKTQYQDELIFGGEYQFLPAWSGGLRFVHRAIKRVIEDFGVLSDPNDPMSYGDKYVIGNPGEQGLGSGFRKPTRDYKAIELTLQRRRTTNWQLVSSFLYARSRGDYEGLYRATNDILAPNGTDAYDSPAFQVNAFGRLASDRPYQLKIHGSYAFPIGLNIAEGFIFSAGSPISTLGPEVYIGYGNGHIFLLPRGSQGRTPNYWTLDLHADYVLPFFGNGKARLSMIADIFNATNNHQVLTVDQNYVYQQMPGFDQWSADANLDQYGNPRFNPNLASSAYYKTPLVYQPPRYVQMGIKFTY